MNENATPVPVRALVAVLIFFGSFISYMLRVHISVMLLIIAEFSKYPLNNNLDCPMNNTAHLQYKTFRMNIYFATTNWKPLNPIVIAILMSVYDIGYSFSILLSEPFSEKMGVVRIVGYSTLISGILTILCPLAYTAGVSLLIALRFLIGFLLGFVLPALQILMVRWSAMHERNLFSLSLYGTSVGMIVTYPGSACLIKYLGWQWMNYILGIVAIVWTIIWLLFVTDLPVQHHRISTYEVQVIQFRRISLVERRRRRRVPWYHIFRSRPIWALFILLWGNTWNLSFYLDYLPLYFYSVLNYDVMMASGLTSLPIVARLIFSAACLPLATLLVQKNCFSSLGNIRKMFTVLSHIVPAVIQLGLLYPMLCSRIISTVAPILVLGINGAIIAGGSLNTVDLAPYFAANISNVMHAVLCFTGAIMPFVVGGIVHIYENHVRGWLLVLLINACIYLIGGIGFLIFGSGSAQEWDFSSVRGAISLNNVRDDDEDMN